MGMYSFLTYILLCISLFIGLILCFFGYRIDQYLITLLKRQSNFYDNIVHRIFPGPNKRVLDLSLVPKFLYMLFWLILSALIQGFGYITRTLLMVLFFVSIDIIVCLTFNLPSFFSIPRAYALGTIIVLAIFFVIIEIYYPIFTKLFVMCMTAFTGALIVATVGIYSENNEFFPLSEEFIRNHFTYYITTLWLALGIFGLFLQYKQDKEEVVYERKEDDDWFEF